ncbi:hypothetical protein C2G38_2175641 [Gigaspora rosea]|uniref:Uncharacterized protein n=1 Tax=Gigaspora rosea TaxID=44941 RepID=A0A397VH16_9GLOM|nr:hypothetical protein C2G38_2175641 [Gigaspora rosea]
MKRNTYHSKRTLSKGTRFKMPYGRTEGYATHTGPEVKRLEKKCATLLEILTEEQAAEVQEIINEVFGNSEIREEQVPQALNFMVKILEDVTEEEEEDTVYLPPYIKVSTSPIFITLMGTIQYKENFDKARVVDLPQNDDEGSTNVVKNPKQEEDEVSLKIVLGSLADAYLEVLKNLIPEFTKPEEPKPQQEFAEMNLEEDKAKDRNKEDIPEVHLEVEALRCACEMWSKKIGEFRQTVEWNKEALCHAYESWTKKVEEFQRIDKWNKDKIELIDEESANTNESAERIEVKEDKNKACIYFQNLADMEIDKETAIEKDRHEVFKDCERLTEIETETDKQTRVKDKHKAFPCYKKTIEMALIDETIEHGHINGIGIKRDEETDTANNLEHACEIWKKKVDKLKTTRKSKNEGPKEPKKYERRTLNLACEVCTTRAEEFKRTITNPHELMQLKKCEIADEEVNLDAETPKKIMTN